MIETRNVARWQREIKAMANAADDPEGFAQLVELHSQLGALLVDQAEKLRDVDGYSWADLARPLGVTRGAAFQRFGRKVARAVGK